MGNRPKIKTVFPEEISSERVFTQEEDRAMNLAAQNLRMLFEIQREKEFSLRTSPKYVRSKAFKTKLAEEKKVLRSLFMDIREIFRGINRELKQKYSSRS